MTSPENNAIQACEIATEASPAMEASECTIAERGLLAARAVLRTAQDVGKIIINGDMSAALRESASHLH